MIGDVKPLIEAMQREPWTEFWGHLGLVLFHFDDLGLTPTSTDLEIWLRCQAEELILITDNRNEDSADSLGATIRTHNTPSSLPVFTIGKLARFQKSKEYADRVVKVLYEYLLDIDRVRGAGRLYLP
jgi:hypothetical protein